MAHNPFYQFLKNRILKPLPGIQAQMKMAPTERITNKYTIPDNAKKSGVLMLLYPFENDLKLVLIIRTDNGGIHSGQIALPGGKYEEEDDNLINTALRETEEEIGIIKEDILLVGEISYLYIPVSNYIVQPVIGFLNTKPNFIKSDDEVAAILTYSLSEIFNNKQQTTISKSQFNIKTPAYILPNQEILWGATAMMMSELEELYKEYLEK